MSLKGRIIRRIQEDGPLTVPQFVTLCLHDPADGYYAVRPALGESGDFITAPMVSQMFGELLGLWAVQVWLDLGAPSRVILAEVGPGDGTLMADALRAAKVAAKFPSAVELWLVEPSPVLRAAQEVRLGAHQPRWAGSVDQLPTDAPLILIANEVLDCMPAHQFVRTADGWAERLVGLDDTGGLSFGLRTIEVEPNPGVPEGAVVEHSTVQAAFAQSLGDRLARQGGCALLIDYGRTEPGPGDTLQALRRHEKVDPLESAGTADLTQWAEFDVVADAARAGGAAVAGPISQAALLQRLGVETRAAALLRNRPDMQEVLARQLDRLLGADQMGELFKAVALYPPDAPTPPGFEEIVQ